VLRVFEKARSRLREQIAVTIERTLVYRQCAPEQPASANVDSRVRVLAANEISRLAEIGPFDRDECEARLERGDRCYSTWVDDALAHYQWIQTTGIHPIDAAALPVPIAARELWIYNCRTSDQHRGQGLYAQTLRRVTSDFFEAGYAVAWIYAAEDNVASLKGIARAGFTHTATLRALRVGRRYVRLAD
jgi:RimJ/RimL family protein N-acetyltransferase